MVFGKKLENGNLITLEYIVTNKTSSNGAKTFALQGSVGGFTDVSITTNSVSQGGADSEDNESVKFNAPLSFAAQDRAVTTTDYETLVKGIYPNALSVSVGVVKMMKRQDMVLLRLQLRQVLVLH